MNFKKWMTLGTLFFSFPFLGCANVFDGMANKNTDEAVYEDAQKAMDASEWDTALSKFSSLSADFQKKPDVIEAWATSYAGKCGLDFVSYFSSLSSASMTGSTIMLFLMNAWTGKDINPAQCTLAQTKMEEISTDPAARSNGQNFFLAILGMVKMGVFLRTYADLDGTGNKGDGTPDAAVNVCTNDASNLPQAGLDEIITGMGLLTTNLSYLTTVLPAGSTMTALLTIESVCAGLAGACSKTKPADITNTDRDSFRDILKTGSGNTTAPIGIGNCVDPAVVPCC
jgi:hypothetical protein